MLQTATHIFVLALVMLRAFAPRTLNRQEGIMAPTSHGRQLQQHLKVILNLRHVDSKGQRAVVYQSARNSRQICAMKSSIDSAAIG